MPFVNYLYLDMNAYFASVEQQDRPELRGRPVAVAPVMAETTSCIAASYEAKALGVKTGTRISDARRMCPGLRVVEARPARYYQVHKRIIEAFDTCLPVGPVKSIDELYTKLVGKERDPNESVKIARKIKEVFQARLGRYLTCSIGLGPNVLIAKMAADMQKPDGLTVVRDDEVPEALFALDLRDIPGVGHRMEKRLHSLGITTVEGLCKLSVKELAPAWNSRLLADHWYRTLRGEDIPEPPSPRRSLGHSHVLGPEWRTPEKSKAVLLRLVEKAATRLRSIDHWTKSIRVSISYLYGSHWSDVRKLGWCRDTPSLIRAAMSMWDTRPPGTPLKVGVTFGDLSESRNVPVTMLPEDRERNALTTAIDAVNRRYGTHAVYFAGMHGAQTQAPTRIAFGQVIGLEFDVQNDQDVE